MSDDGTGHSINIPSFIVKKKDADKIKKFLTGKDQQKVYIKAALEMVHPDNRVEYEFWYSTILDIDFDKLVDIALF
jgi:ribosomal protein S4